MQKNVIVGLVNLLELHEKGGDDERMEFGRDIVITKIEMGTTYFRRNSTSNFTFA